MRSGWRTTHGPELGVNRKTVILWRKRFAQSGLDVRDRTRPGRKPATLNSSNASSIQRFTRSPGRPRIGAPAPSPSTWASPRWPSSASGKRTDCSPIASKLSKPRQARNSATWSRLVRPSTLSVDEKSQIQALDRSQPGFAPAHDPRLQTTGRCSPPSMCSTAAGSVCRDIGRNSSNSYARSIAKRHRR